MIGGKKIAINTLFLMVSSILNLGISIFTTSIIARAIGPELYGRYTFGLTYVSFVSSFANFGIISLFIRDAASDKRNLSKIIDILHFKTLLAIFTVIVIILTAHLLGYKKDAINVIYVLSIGVVFQILTETLLSFFQAMERIHVNAVAATLFRILSAIVIVIAVYGGIGYWGIVSAFSIGNGLVFCVVAMLFYREHGLLHLKPNYRNWIVLMKRGMPFYMSALFTTFYSRIHVIYLSKMVSERDIGFYMASLNLVDNLSFVIVAFNSSIFPALSRMHKDSSAALKRTYEKMMKYIIILSTAVCVGTILVGREVINLIYGREFSEATQTLQILIFFWAFTFFSQTQSSLLFSVGEEKWQAKIMGMACMLSAVLSPLLIHAYGLIGAALALVVTEFLMAALITVRLAGVGYKYKPDAHLARLGVAAIGMFFVVKCLLGLNLGLAVIGGGLFYTLFLFVGRVFDAEDVGWMLSLVRGRDTSGKKMRIM